MDEEARIKQLEDRVEALEIKVGRGGEGFYGPEDPDIERMVEDFDTLRTELQDRNDKIMVLTAKVNDLEHYKYPKERLDACSVIRTKVMEIDYCEIHACEASACEEMAAKRLLMEWQDAPFFEKKEDWEAWVKPLLIRIGKVVNRDQEERKTSKAR